MTRTAKIIFSLFVACFFYQTAFSDHDHVHTRQDDAAFSDQVSVHRRSHTEPNVIVHSPARPSENSPERLQVYHDSGQYAEDLENTTQAAEVYISQRISQNRHHRHPEKLAIVLDVDETSLTNYHQIHQDHFAFDRERMEQYQLRAVAPPIPPVLRLYRQARSAGVSVFFVTGRPQSECPATSKNLQRAGYHRWTALFCRATHDRARSAIPYKKEVRKVITDRGYHIIASIGDQWSDLRGGYTEKGFKLPNPYYHIP